MGDCIHHKFGLVVGCCLLYPNRMENPENKDSARGFGFALAAYLLWGFLPLYMKAMAHIPPVEVIAHRVLWSVPNAGVGLWWLGRTQDLAQALG